MQKFKQGQVLCHCVQASRLLFQDYTLGACVCVAILQRPLPNHWPTEVNVTTGCKMVACKYFKLCSKSVQLKNLLLKEWLIFDTSR